MPVTRRRFLTDSTAAAAGAGAASLLLAAVRTRAQGVSPSDKIVVGVIGCNGMGFSNLWSLLRMEEVECGALCEVDAGVLERRRRDVEAMTSVTPKVYGDYRTLLENRDLDAVVIGTPDHWHCLQMVRRARRARTSTAMKTRRQPVCNAEVGSLAAVNAHRGNIAFRTGAKVHWDGTHMTFRTTTRPTRSSRRSTTVRRSCRAYSAYGRL